MGRLCLVPLLVLVAACWDPITEPADVREVRRTAVGYLAAIDNRNMERLEQIVHPEFRIVIEQQDKQLQILTKAQLLWLVLAHELGGDSRVVDDISVKVSGSRAFAYVRYEGHQAKFDAMQTFIQQDGRWKMIHALVWYDPKPGRLDASHPLG